MSLREFCRRAGTSRRWVSGYAADGRGVVGSRGKNGIVGGTWKKMTAERGFVSVSSQKRKGSSKGDCKYEERSKKLLQDVKGVVKVKKKELQKSAKEVWTKVESNEDGSFGSVTKKMKIDQASGFRGRKTKVKVGASNLILAAAPPEHTFLELIMQDVRNPKRQRSGLAEASEKQAEKSSSGEKQKQTAVDSNELFEVIREYVRTAVGKMLRCRQARQLEPHATAPSIDLTAATQQETAFFEVITQGLQPTVRKTPVLAKTSETRVEASQSGGLQTDGTIDEEFLTVITENANPAERQASSLTETREKETGAIALCVQQLEAAPEETASFDLACQSAQTGSETSKAAEASETRAKASSPVGIGIQTDEAIDEEFLAVITAGANHAAGQSLRSADARETEAGAITPSAEQTEVAPEETASFDSPYHDLQAMNEAAEASETRAEAGPLGRMQTDEATDEEFLAVMTADANQAAKQASSLVEMRETRAEASSPDGMQTDEAIDEEFLAAITADMNHAERQASDLAVAREMEAGATGPGVERTEGAPEETASFDLPHHDVQAVTEAAEASETRAVAGPPGRMQTDEATDEEFLADITADANRAAKQASSLAEVRETRAEASSPDRMQTDEAIDEEFLAAITSDMNHAERQASDLALACEVEAGATASSVERTEGAPEETASFDLPYHDVQAVAEAAEASETRAEAGPPGRMQTDEATDMEFLAVMTADAHQAAKQASDSAEACETEAGATVPSVERRGTSFFEIVSKDLQTGNERSKVAEASDTRAEASSAGRMQTDAAVDENEFSVTKADSTNSAKGRKLSAEREIQTETNVGRPSKPLTDAGKAKTGLSRSEKPKRKRESRRKTPASPKAMEKDSELHGTDATEKLAFVESIVRLLKSFSDRLLRGWWGNWK